MNLAVAWIREISNMGRSM